jgi:hypothetical protein
MPHPITIQLPKHPGGQDRLALEEAALTRLARVLGEAVVQAPTSMLAVTASATTDLSAATAFLAKMIPALAMEQDYPLASALLRGAHVKEELIQASGGAASAEEVAQLLGITRQAVDKRRRAGTLLAVESPSGDWRYPRAQFQQDGKPIAHLERVLRAFTVADPWMQLDALTAIDPALGNRSAFDALKAGEVDTVIRIVQAFGEHGS